jgi:hypothetical protein
MQDNTKDNRTQPNLAGGLYWGASNIGCRIERTETQVYYLFKKGHFGDAVKKVGKTLVGSEVGLARRFGPNTS